MQKSHINNKKEIAMIFKKQKKETDKIPDPEDIKEIRKYLKSIGSLKATDKELSKAWISFSETYSASWLDPTDKYKEKFGDWLDKILN